MRKARTTLTRIAVALLIHVAAVAVAAAQQSNPAASKPVAAEMGADGVQRLTVVMDSYSFTPDHIVVQAGRPVEFNLKNVSTLAPHSLKIDSAEGGLFVDQDVKAGAGATVKFTPARPGTYSFWCDKKLLFFPSHRDKGMVGQLDVR